jgi:hypothetical protein
VYEKEDLRRIKDFKESIFYVEEAGKCEIKLFPL